MDPDIVLALAATRALIQMLAEMQRRPGLTDAQMDQIMEARDEMIMEMARLRRPRAAAPAEPDLGSLTGALRPAGA